MAGNMYIGLMSGTSFDGIDAALMSFDNHQINIIDHHYQAYPPEIKNALLALAQQEHQSLENIFSLDAKLGHLYAQAAVNLLKKSGRNPKDIQAIGCHGQTICHMPQATEPFSVQIGNPNIVAAQTGIKTVADFRRADMAQGGQGAPLAPAFHREFFHSPDVSRAIVNIGGFANVTLLPKDGTVSGFDTGPGNCFIDAWVNKHFSKPFDHAGQWASTGTLNNELLSTLLTHPHFAKHPPKSTGRDDFSFDWVNNVLGDFADISPQDIQTTLTALTAVSIAQNVGDAQEVYICGGGALNAYLMSLIAERLPSATVNTTEALGVDPQHVEACLMGWLASCNLNHHPIDLRAITGSQQPVILGGVYFA